MRFLAGALVQALPWIKQSPATLLTGVLTSLTVDRLLDQSFMEDVTDTKSEEDEQFFDAIMSDLDFCDIDFMAIETSITNGALSLATTGSSQAMSMEPSQAASLMNQFMSVLAPNERICSPSQIEKYLDGQKEWAKCTGLSTTLNNQLDTQLLQSIQSQCSDPQNAQACMDTLLGDNPVGFLARDFYRNFKKYVSCSEEHFGSDLPSCYVTLGSLADKAAADGTTPQEDTVNSIDPTYRGMHLSLTLLKKAVCIMGVGVESFMGGLCYDALESLDKCLTVDATSCETTQQACTESVLFSVPPKITQGMLPDVCVQVLRRDAVAPEVMKHFLGWMGQCHRDDIIINHPFLGDGTDATKEAKDEAEPEEVDTVVKDVAVEEPEPVAETAEETAAKIEPQTEIAEELATETEPTAESVPPKEVDTVVQNVAVEEPEPVAETVEEPEPETTEETATKIEPQTEIAEALATKTEPTAESVPETETEPVPAAEPAPETVTPEEMEPTAASETIMEPEPAKEPEGPAESELPVEPNPEPQIALGSVESVHDIDSGLSHDMDSSLSKESVAISSSHEPESDEPFAPTSYKHSATFYCSVSGLALVLTVGIIIWQRKRQYPVRSGFQQLQDSDTDLEETEMGRFY